MALLQINEDFKLRYQTVVFTDAAVPPNVLEFGLVKEVKLTIKGKDIGKDSFGRTVNGGFEVKGEFNVMASDNTMLQSLAAGARDFGTADMQFTGVGGDITIPSVLLNLDFEIDMNGAPSKLKITFDRLMTAQEVYDAFLATETGSIPGISPGTLI